MDKMLPINKRPILTLKNRHPIFKPCPSPAQFPQVSQLATLSKAMVQQLGVVTKSFRQFAKVHHLDDIRRDHLLDWRKHLLTERQVAVASYNNYLRKEEQHNMPDWFWEAVVKTLYYTGIRRRQLVGLCWGDIDRQHSTLMLRAENSKTREEWSIPVAPQLQVVFDELARLTQARLGRMFRADEQVFNLTLFKSGYKGKVLTVEHVSAAFRRIRENTGIEVSPHRFRHTFATKLAKQGKIRDLQQMMGHSDVRTTLGYVQPDLNNMRQMLGGLGEICRVRFSLSRKNRRWTRPRIVSALVCQP